MRKEVHKKLQRGRVLRGAYGTDESFGLTGAFLIAGPEGRQLKIMASDGRDWPFAGLAWEHVSVSTRKSTPTWAEMAHIKSLFWEPEECVIQYHPPQSSYVNIHDSCLHLWKPIGIDFPMPPKGCV